MYEKNLIAVILLSIFTCGIYNLIWFVSTTNDIEEAMVEKEGDSLMASGGLTFLLIIVTCGLYTIFWVYRQSKRVVKLAAENDLVLIDNSLLNVLLCILTANVVPIAIIQNDLNNIAKKQNAEQKTV